MRSRCALLILLFACGKHAARPTTGGGGGGDDVGAGGAQMTDENGGGSVDARTPDQAVIDTLAQSGYQCAVEESRWRCDTVSKPFFVWQRTSDNRIFVDTFLDRQNMQPCSRLLAAVQPMANDVVQFACWDTNEDFLLQTSYVYSADIAPKDHVDALYNERDKVVAALTPLGFLVLDNEQRSPGKIAVDILGAHGITCKDEETRWACTGGAFGQWEALVSWTDANPATIQIESGSPRAFAKPCEKFNDAMTDLRMDARRFDARCDDSSQHFWFRSTLTNDRASDLLGTVDSHVELRALSVKRLKSIKAIRID